MLTLTVDIGGAFDGERMIRREPRATDQAGGPCPLREIEQLMPLGKAVVFAEQRVARSTGTASLSEGLEARC